MDLRSPSEEFIGRRIGRFGAKGIWLIANGRAQAVIDRRRYHLIRKDDKKAEWADGVGATGALALQAAVAASDGVVWLAGADGVWISRPGQFPSAERVAEAPPGEALLATSTRIWLVDGAKAHWWAPASTPTPAFTKAFVGPPNAGAAQAVLEEKPDVFWFGWPRGGGTSVCGGVEPEVGSTFNGTISLDLTRLDRVLEVDATSRAARIQGGIRVPALENELNPTA